MLKAKLLQSDGSYLYLEEQKDGSWTIPSGTLTIGSLIESITYSSDSAAISLQKDENRPTKEKAITIPAAEQIDNLVLSLNHVATQRQELHDQMWKLEEVAKQILIKLVKLIRAGEVLDER